jgi:hypothetical protein
MGKKISPLRGRTSSPKGKVKGNSHKKKGAEGRRRFPLGLIPLGLLLLLAAGGWAAFERLRSRPVWYLEGEIAAVWADVLAAGDPPFSRVEPYPGEGKIPKNRYGYLISAAWEKGGPSSGDRGKEDSPEAGNPLRIYPGLSRTREYGGALALALNPWMVFSRHQDPLLSRGRVEARSGGAGRLILAGGDSRAAWAWMAQLLQGPPGTFPPQGEAWDPARLYRDRRFQNGAVTYTWEDAWALFFRERESWIYAPLQMVRELSPFQMGLLRSARFPEGSGWTEYGIQADILWAIPLMGKEEFSAPLKEISRWLRDARTQTLIANQLNWIPAHPGGASYNPVSREAQFAWMGSSFVWQDQSAAFGVPPFREP